MSEPFTHAHVHEHADGTIHSHYHTHVGGEVAHEHSGSLADEIVFDPHVESHAADAIPEHSHETLAKVDPPLRAQELTYTYPKQTKPVFEKLSL